MPDSVWAEPDCDAARGRDEALRRGSRETGAEREGRSRPRADRERILLGCGVPPVGLVHRQPGGLAAQIPRVAMVSTWNSRCGVAENTRNIVENASGSARFEIFADKQAVIIDPDRDHGVVREWVSRWQPELGDLDFALELSDPDVVHFQFNFGFFELDRLSGLINRQLERRAVVMTLHRTRDIDIEGELVSLSSIRSTLEHVDRLIVHQASDAQVLAEMGLSANVSVVPMGTAPPPKVSHTEARKMLGLGSRPVIGTFGFLLPHKGTLELVGVIDSLRAEFPDICLLALCARYPDVTLGLLRRAV